jgi:hypothetical protein
VAGGTGFRSTQNIAIFTPMTAQQTIPTRINTAKCAGLRRSTYGPAEVFCNAAAYTAAAATPPIMCQAMVPRRENVAAHGTVHARY